MSDSTEDSEALCGFKTLIYSQHRFARTLRMIHPITTLVISLSMTNLSKVFEEIYIRGHWGDGFGTPKSGSGSDPSLVFPYVNFVKDKVNQLGIKTVVDVGHGDWRMWRDWKFEGIKYTGIEVSETAHLLAKTEYFSSNLEFLIADVLETNQIPEADMLITKDVLQHLSNQNVEQLLLLFSRFRFIIICNDMYQKMSLVGAARYHLRIRTRLRMIMKGRNPFFKVVRSNNREIQDGDFRGIDLQISPLKHLLPGHDLQEMLDFDAPKRDGIRKRVYFFARR